jgi:hypothetical protein
VSGTRLIGDLRVRGAPRRVARSSRRSCLPRRSCAAPSGRIRVGLVAVVRATAESVSTAGRAGQRPHRRSIALTSGMPTYTASGTSTMLVTRDWRAPATSSRRGPAVAVNSKREREQAGPDHHGRPPPGRRTGRLRPADGDRGRAPSVSRSAAARHRAREALASQTASVAALSKTNATVTAPSSWRSTCESSGRGRGKPRRRAPPPRRGAARDARQRPAGGRHRHREPQRLRHGGLSGLPGAAARRQPVHLVLDDVHDRRSVLGQGLLQRRAELVVGCHPYAVTAQGPGEFGQVGIAVEDPEIAPACAARCRSRVLP